MKSSLCRIPSAQDPADAKITSFLITSQEIMWSKDDIEAT